MADDRPLRSRGPDGSCGPPFHHHVPAVFYNRRRRERCRLPLREVRIEWALIRDAVAYPMRPREIASFIVFASAKEAAVTASLAVDCIVSRYRAQGLLLHPRLRALGSELDEGRKAEGLLNREGKRRSRLGRFAVRLLLFMRFQKSRQVNAGESTAHRQKSNNRKMCHLAAGRLADDLAADVRRQAG